VRAGVWLAGVDVIGGVVIEVNTLNPGGLHHINDKTEGGVDFQLAMSIERWVANRRN
jgi:glutathione synthase/RimK-type ligase-like ATP-grasp enzyme